MREGWEVKKVSDVASVRSGATPSTKDQANWDGEIPWLTPKDLSERPAKYTERGTRSITKLGLKKTTLVPAGSVLLTSRAPVGYVSIARNPISTNQGFKTLILEDGQISEFWYYLLQNSTRYLLSNSGGSTFKEISKKSVENLQFLLPPIHEQKRIVDLMDSVDAAISAAQDEVEALANLLRKLRDVHPPSRAGAKLGDLVTLRSGPSWRAADESAIPGEGREPVLGITNTPSDGVMDLSVRKFVKGIPTSAKRLTDSSLVMIRTNGNRARIGNIYRTAPGAVGHAVSAFQIAIQASNSEDSEFLYWILGSDSGLCCKNREA